MIIDLSTGKEISEFPSGVVGQISFRRLVEQLRAAGEFNANEVVTHLRIDASRSLIQYRLETE